MKTVLISLAIFVAGASAFADQLPKLRCSIQQATGENGDLKRTIFKTEIFDDLSKNQQMATAVPEQLDVYADITAVEKNSRVRIYVQVTHKDVNVLLGAAVSYYDINSPTMEVEVDSMQGTNFSATVYCKKI